MVSTPRKRKLSPYGKEEFGLPRVKQPLMDFEDHSFNIYNTKSRFMRRLDYSSVTEDDKENTDSDEPLQLNAFSFYCKKSQYLNPLERKSLGLSKISRNVTNDAYVPMKVNYTSKNDKLKNKMKNKASLASIKHKKATKKHLKTKFKAKTFSKSVVKAQQKESSIKVQNNLFSREPLQENSKLSNSTNRKFFVSRDERCDRKVFTSSEEWRKGLRLKFKSGVAAVLNKPNLSSPVQDIQVKTENALGHQPKGLSSVTENVLLKAKKYLTPQFYEQDFAEMEPTKISALSHIENKETDKIQNVPLKFSDTGASHFINKEDSVVDDNYNLVKNKPVIVSNHTVFQYDKKSSSGNNNDDMKLEEKESLDKNTTNIQGNKEVGASYPIFNLQITSKTDTVNKTVKRQYQDAPHTTKGLHVNSNSLRFMQKLNSKSDRKEQLIIDAGQKEIGARQCSVCNMVYTRGEPQDEQLHSSYHEMFQTSLRFPGWKKEHVLGDFHDGRVIMVTKNDQNFKLKKLTDILRIVDRDLGFPDLGLPCKMNITFILFISNEKKVIGCLVAESITQACRVILDTSSRHSVPCLPSDEETKDKNFCTEGIWCSSSEPVKAICGISRIWTSFEHRRCKVASRMIDCLRCNFIYGYALSMDEIAFSDPSLDGRAFAASYTGTPSFLVYK